MTGIMKSVVIGNVIVAVCVVGSFIWAMWLPHPEISKKPLSLAEFTERFGSSDFPATATNIYYGRSSVGLQGRAHIYRFEARLHSSRHLRHISHQHALIH